MDNRRDKILIAVFGIPILCVIVWIIARDSGIKKGVNFRIKELYDFSKKINIKQAEFKPDIDYGKIVDAVVNVGEEFDQRDFAGFSQSLGKIHEEILKYVSEIIVLSEAEEKQILLQYGEFHDQIARDYYDEHMVAMANPHYGISVKYKFRKKEKTELLLDNRD